VAFRPDCPSSLEKIKMAQAIVKTFPTLNDSALTHGYVSLTVCLAIFCII